MTKVLITGGAGFIGYHLSKYLVDKGYEVTIIDNFSRGNEDEDFINLIEKENVFFIKGDLTDPKTLENVKDSFDYIYHLAMINGTPNFYKIPDKVLDIGILGTLNLLKWLSRKRNKGKLLFASSSEVYASALKIMKNFPIPTPEEVPLVIDDPTNVRWSYGASKMIGEVMMHSYAKIGKIKDYCIIRYHNVYGPRMGFDHVIPQVIERIMKKENPFKIYGAEQTRTFCYVEDAVRATQLVMESRQTNGKTIHIGRSDDEIKIKNLIEKLFEIADYDPKRENVDAPTGSVDRRCPDTTKLKNLGFKAMIDLDEGLRKCFGWYENNIRKSP